MPHRPPHPLAAISPLPGGMEKPNGTVTPSQTSAKCAGCGPDPRRNNTAAQWRGPTNCGVWRWSCCSQRCRGRATAPGGCQGCTRPTRLLSTTLQSRPLAAFGPASRPPARRNPTGLGFLPELLAARTRRGPWAVGIRSRAGRSMRSRPTGTVCTPSSTPSSASCYAGPAGAVMPCSAGLSRHGAGWLRTWKSGLSPKIRPRHSRFQPEEPFWSPRSSSGLPMPVAERSLQVRALVRARHSARVIAWRKDRGGAGGLLPPNALPPVPAGRGGCCVLAIDIPDSLIGNRHPGDVSRAGMRLESICQARRKNPGSQGTGVFRGRESARECLRWRLKPPRSSCTGP